MQITIESIEAVGPENAALICTDDASTGRTAGEIILSRWAAPAITCHCIVVSLPRVQHIEQMPSKPLHLMYQHPHITWQLCLAHESDLFLEHVGKLPSAQEVVGQGRTAIKFVRRHCYALNALRQRSTCSSSHQVRTPVDALP